MKVFKLFPALLIAALLVSCGSNNKQGNESVSDETIALGPSIPKNDSSALKIYIDQAGVITANGEVTTLTALDSALEILKNKRGVVWYSRDNKNDEPPKGAMEVMDMVANRGLPVQFYTDKTFTQIYDLK